MMSRETKHLFDAIARNKPKSIPKLLATGADLSAKNKEHQTAIHYAAALGHWKCVRAIAKRKNTTKKDLYNYSKALRLAIEKNEYASAKILVKAGAATESLMLGMSDNKAATKIFKAIYNNNANEIKEHFNPSQTTVSVSNFHPVDHNKRRPLLFAAQNKYWECVKELIPPLLLDHNPLAYFDCIHVAFLAFQAGRLEIANDLIDAIGGVNGSCCSYLQDGQKNTYHLVHLVGQNYPDKRFILYLLNKNADFNIKNDMNKTAFQVVIQSKHWSIATLLLDITNATRLISALPISFVKETLDSKEASGTDFYFFLKLVNKLYNFVCEKKVPAYMLAHVYRYILDCQLALSKNTIQGKVEEIFLKQQVELKHYTIMIKNTLINLQEALIKKYGVDNWITTCSEEVLTLHKRLKTISETMTPVEIFRLYSNVVRDLITATDPFLREQLEELQEININVVLPAHQTMNTTSTVYTTLQNNSMQNAKIDLAPVYLHRHSRSHRPEHWDRSVSRMTNTATTNAYTNTYYHNTLFQQPSLMMTEPDPTSTLAPVYLSIRMDKR